MRRIGAPPRVDESDEEPPDDHDTLDDALSVTEAWLQGANGTVAGAGNAISDMADMVGWGTFTIEHLIFGMMLGVGVAVSRRLPQPSLTPRQRSVVAA